MKIRSQYSEVRSQKSEFFLVRHCEETDCVDEAVYACVDAKSMDCHTPLTVVLAKTEYKFMKIKKRLRFESRLSIWKKNMH